MMEIFKALGDENRLRILNILMSYELCVCELEVILEMTQSNVSRHLGKLKNIGIINALKDAQWVHYKLSEAYVENNALLIEYLKLEFNNRESFEKDRNRYKIYKSSGYNCQTITNDKIMVAEYINSKIK